ncbi:unnamed protein product, partial [Prorocentrum cordatum]
PDQALPPSRRLCRRKRPRRISFQGRPSVRGPRRVDGRERGALPVDAVDGGVCGALVAEQGALYRRGPRL